MGAAGSEGGKDRDDGEGRGDRDVDKGRDGDDGGAKSVSGALDLAQTMGSAGPSNVDQSNHSRASISLNAINFSMTYSCRRSKRSCRRRKEGGGEGEEEGGQEGGQEGSKQGRR